MGVPMRSDDVVVIGAGIVGLATAFELQRREPRLAVTVVDKEPEVAQHQSGRNSGVIHAGLYYRPGSERARLCRSGRQQLIAFCREQGLAHELCGKVVVAVDERELEHLSRLEARAAANGVAVQPLDPQQLAELEPHARGLRALYVPDTGIVDFRQVSAQLAERVQGAPGQRGRVLCGAEVYGIEARGADILLRTTRGAWLTRRLVNCAGLQSDRVARLAGQRPSVSIVPFKGEFYELSGEARQRVRHLIYPVPDPEFPFLGVHLTRTVWGAIECGPNALLALGRETYGRWQLEPGDLGESLGLPGLWRFARRHWRPALGEWQRSLSRAAFAEALGRLCSGIGASQLTRGRTGIRAQAIDAEGRLADDFVFEQTGRVLSVCNAPSPAATASLAIGRRIADRLLREG